MLRTVLIVAAVFVVLWIGFVAFVFLARPDDASLGDAVRLLPDSLRTIRRIATDHAIPARTRWLLWLLLAYLAFPIDLVPDFLPVVGYADDAIITSLVLRHVLRRAGPAKLQEHWPGTADGLAMLTRLLRLPEAPNP